MANPAYPVRAVIVKPAENARQPDNKETVSAYSLVVSHKGELKEAIVCRVYMGRSRQASEMYACIWVHGIGTWASGKGSAGGYGYHKESQAIADAIDSAGIELYGNPYKYHAEKPDMKKRFHLGGTGDSCYLEIFKAIAKAAGYSPAKAILIRH